MKISIITVCKNAEKRIGKALDSVAQQTYPEIEYIVIDGNSTDGTKQIIEKYSDSISKFISESDQGVYEAMNKGIRLASGDFIFFLNSDDCLIDQTVVADVVDFLTEHPDCDFIYGNLLFCIEQESGDFNQLITFPQPDGIPEHLIADCLLHQASFARKSLFEKLGYFSERYRIGSDYEWFLKLVGDDTVKLCYYPRAIASYHAGGMSSDMNKTLAEMFEIQNHAPIYQTEFWLKKRILRYQEILKNPQGRFGLQRPMPEPPKPQVQPQLSSSSNEQLRKLKVRIQKLKAREQQLQQQLREAETTIVAMSTSKFWKLRSAWFRLKKMVGLSTESSSSNAKVPEISQPEIEPTAPQNSKQLSLEQPMFSQSQESSEWDALYARIREPKAKGYITCSPAQANKIVQWFTRFGIEVEDYAIDAEEYRQYFQTARYSEDFPNYYSFNLPEKSLEHFIAAKLLDLSVDDVYIDIASEGSPVPEIYSKLFGTKTFRQDLSYAPGINGNLIGGDAANMPVPDGFASKMALHCSLEHFEGTSDIGFIKEIARVLRPGGAVCVVPLYLTEKYSIQTDPVISVPSNVTFEEDAIIHCASGWNNRHGRFYDPEHFVNRIYKNLNGLSVKLYRIINAKQIDSSCYVQFAAIIKK